MKNSCLLPARHGADGESHRGGAESARGRSLLPALAFLGVGAVQRRSGIANRLQVAVDDELIRRNLIQEALVAQRSCDSRRATMGMMIAPAIRCAAARVSFVESAVSAAVIGTARETTSSGSVVRR